MSRNSQGEPCERHSLSKFGNHAQSRFLHGKRLICKEIVPHSGEQITQSRASNESPRSQRLGQRHGRLPTRICCLRSAGTELIHKLNLLTLLECESSDPRFCRPRSRGLASICYAAAQSRIMPVLQRAGTSFEAPAEAL